MEVIQSFYHAEHSEGNDDEVQYDGDGVAEVDGHFGQLHGYTVGLHYGFFQNPFPGGEINAAGNHRDQGHDDVIDDGSSDLAESTANNNADSHVDHVTAHCKCLKFVKKLFHFV